MTGVHPPSPHPKSPMWQRTVVGCEPRWRETSLLTFGLLIYKRSRYISNWLSYDANLYHLYLLNFLTDTSPNFVLKIQRGFNQLATSASPVWQKIGFFRKDLFKWANSESLLLVCFVHFLAWFYSWKIECDVRARCILLLKKVWKRETVRYLKNIHELPFSQNSPKKLSLQRQSKVLELKFGMQVPPFWHGDEEHGDWKRGNDC